MEGLDLGRNESHADIRAKKCKMSWKALARLSFKEFVDDGLWSRTSAVLAEVPRNETALSALLSQANHSFSSSVRSSVSLTSFLRYSVLQK